MKQEEIFIQLPQGVPAGFGGTEGIPDGDYVFGWARTNPAPSAQGGLYNFNRDGRAQQYTVDARGNLALIAAEPPSRPRPAQPRIQVSVVPYQPRRHWWCRRVRRVAPARPALCVHRRGALRGPCGLPGRLRPAALGGEPVPAREWWCDACGTSHPSNGAWFALWHTAQGGLQIQPTVAPWLTYESDVRHAYRKEVYACGQGSALVLVERFLHTGGFTSIEVSPAAAFMTKKF